MGTRSECSAVSRPCERSGCRLGPEELTVGSAEYRFHATAAATVDHFGFEAATFGLDAADIVTEIVFCFIASIKIIFICPTRWQLC
jgi:hypothetical protein